MATREISGGWCLPRRFGRIRGAAHNAPAPKARHPCNNFLRSILDSLFMRVVHAAHGAAPQCMKIFPLWIWKGQRSRREREGDVHPAQDGHPPGGGFAPTPLKGGFS